MRNLDAVIVCSHQLLNELVGRAGIFRFGHVLSPKAQLVTVKVTSVGLFDKARRSLRMPSIDSGTH